MFACPKSFPCGTCQTEVSDGIKCDVCHAWTHQRCSRLNKKIFELYCRENKLIWVCYKCRSLAKTALRNIAYNPPGTNSQMPERRVTCVISTDTQANLSTADENHRSKMHHKLTEKSNVVHAPKSNKPKIHMHREEQQQMSMMATTSKDLSYRDALMSKPNTDKNISQNLNTELNVIMPKKKLKIRKNRNEIVEITNLKSAVDSCTKGLESLTKELNQLRLRYDTELGRNRNILVHGYEEHSSTIPHVRKKAHEALVKTILRNADLLPNTRWRRVHRVGRWTRGCSPRPLLVEFSSQKDRDILLSRLSRVYERLRLPLRITPDIRDKQATITGTISKPHPKITTARVVVNPLCDSKLSSELANACNAQCPTNQLFEQNQKSLQNPSVHTDEMVNEVWHDANDGAGLMESNSTGTVERHATQTDTAPTEISASSEAPDDTQVPQQDHIRLTRSMTSIGKNAMIPRVYCPRD